MTDKETPGRLHWDDLRLFLAVARHGTLTAAADHLGATQPTIGRRLRQLEESTGGALFQRGPGGFRLTELGETILLHAQTIEGEALEIERKIVGGEQRFEGLLRLSTSDWFASRVLAAPLARFAQMHPNLSIELIADFRLSSLHRRDADLVFRFTEFDEADVLQRRFCRIDYQAYVGADYIALNGDPNESADGSGHRLITMDTALAAAADMKWLLARWPRARLAFRSNNRESQASACSENLGIAVLPRLIGDALNLHRLDRISPPDRNVWLGYHRDLRTSRRLKALVDHLTHEIGAQI
jgi:DNA-binding transcriptional LysR family regulator